MTQELRYMSEADKRWLTEQIRAVVKQEKMKPSTEKALRWFLKRELAIAYMESKPCEEPDAEKHNRLLCLWKQMEEEDET